VPQAVKGPSGRIKWLVRLLTLSIYYVTPFLRWDRGRSPPGQAVVGSRTALFGYGPANQQSESTGVPVDAVEGPAAVQVRS
jgi:hypothetical protein